MNRIFVALLVAVSAGLIVLGGNFYWKNLRGVGPAFGPTPVAPTGDSPKPSDNATGLPLTLPDGFRISVFAADLGGARVLRTDPAGTLVVSVPSAGKVLALPDRNHDGSADLPVIVVSGLNRPHGLAFRDGKLYVAETDGISEYAYDPKTNKATGGKRIMDLPGGGNHFSRTIGFGPDGRLYVSVGSSCNVCAETDWRRAKILVSNADGSGAREYASGLRNSVFFVWRPGTDELWATDMGRDLLGDEVPSDEINIVKDGGFYGWPYCYEDRVHDSSFDPKNTTDCKTSIPPRIRFPAHSAPLGLAFIPDAWPKEYRGKLLVSFHGSWNRSTPTGYKIVLTDPQSGKQTDFVSGWLVRDGARGRPVDLLFDASGNLYVSDDKAGTIYRISPQK